MLVTFTISFVISLLFHLYFWPVGVVPKVVILAEVFLSSWCIAQLEEVSTMTAVWVASTVAARVLAPTTETILCWTVGRFYLYRYNSRTDR